MFTRICVLLTSKMTEDYYHSDCNLWYVEENIPGPFEDSIEYDNMISYFNSRLTHHCECDSICNTKSCNCLIQSGDANYIQLNKTEMLRLNNPKNAGNYLSYPILECNTTCRCADNCGNRLVQKGPCKGLVVRDCTNISKGKGLFTAEFIPRGVFICEYAGEIITLNQAKARHELNQSQGKMNYIFCLNEYCNGRQLQMFVDPSIFGNLGRYINHSCEPNCVIVPVRVESPLPKLAIFSQIDIPPNCEITYDYGFNSFGSAGEIDKRMKCLCESKICRGVMPFDKY